MAEQIEQARSTVVDEHWGHHWKEPERVQEYVNRSDRQEEDRAERLRYLPGLIPFDPSDAVRILDIGSGHGVVAAAVLDRFSNGSAVGLDISEPMMEIGRERMAVYGERFRYHVGDFASGELPADLRGPFEIVVSSRAIHHLPPANKRRLYQAVFQILGDGGCFFNLDAAEPGDAYLKTMYRQAGALARGQPAERAARPANAPSATGHFPDPVADHLRWLSEAGFHPVDCFWKKLGDALVGGYKPL